MDSRTVLNVGDRLVLLLLLFFYFYFLLYLTELLTLNAKTADCFFFTQLHCRFNCGINILTSRVSV